MCFIHSISVTLRAHVRLFNCWKGNAVGSNRTGYGGLINPAVHINTD